ncbi:MAG TPA: ABC transporter permease subunit, partial [Myxococcota bacterium]|nr:ABC transporter permease subunit [Myxococcota bacterium]
MLPRPRRRPQGIPAFLLGLILCYVSLLLLVPLGALVWTVAGDLQGVLTQLATEEALDALLRSVAVALAAVLLNGTFGVIGALVLVRQRFWGRRILDALVDLPLALSPVMTGLAFLLLFGRSGLLRPLTDAVDLSVAFAWPAVLLATLFVTLPFTLREVALLLEELGDSEEQAAATLGASDWTCFWRVTFPNL